MQLDIEPKYQVFIYLNRNCIFQPQLRPSLDPPPKNDITWEEYISAESGNPPLLGRPLVSKESSKSFKATVAMVIFFFLYSEEKNRNVGQKMYT